MDSEEQCRYAVECIERIELALAERIGHSDEWLPSRVSKPANVTKVDKKNRKLSIREKRAQQWDAKRLISDYTDSLSVLESRESTENQDDWSLDNFLKSFNDICAHVSQQPAINLEEQYHRLTLDKGLRRFQCHRSVGDNVDKIYTSTEDYGQLIDLIEQHSRYTELSSEIFIPYRDYLQLFSTLDVQHNSAGGYYQQLRSCLESAYDRFHPLDLPCKELPAYKQAIQSLKQNSLWCGICQKEFSSKGVFESHLKGRKHLRNLENGSSPSSSTKVDKAVIKVMSDLLAPEIESTVKNIDRRGGMTDRERMLEADISERQRAEEDEYASDSEEKPEAVPGSTSRYLGADGRPIPHWLFKLQGLGVQFTCQICGGFKYQGRKEYDRHFREQRHQNGLKCLHITPSELYSGISSIEEAMQLHKASLVKQTQKNVVAEAEVEDDQGNVMTQKVYEDLKRQGLL